MGLGWLLKTPSVFNPENWHHRPAVADSWMLFRRRLSEVIDFLCGSFAEWIWITSGALLQRILNRGLTSDDSALHPPSSTGFTGLQQPGIKLIFYRTTK